MTDITDDGTDTEMRQRDAAHEAARTQEARRRLLAAARIRAQGQPPAECSVCGDKIAAARRSAVPGCIRCAPCESNHETRKRLGTV